MSWYTIFYLFSLADKISLVFGTLTIIIGIMLGIVLLALIGCEDFDDDDWSKWRKYFFTFFISGFLSLSLWTFMPDRKDMLLIVAGGAVGEFVVNNEHAKQLPNDITMFLRKEILDATSDLKNPEIIKEQLGIETESEKLKKLTKEELIKLLKESK